jgi:hypothetical protein
LWWEWDVVGRGGGGGLGDGGDGDDDGDGKMDGTWTITGYLELDLSRSRGWHNRTTNTT